jgi:phosphatidate cytidylyltransferase
VGTALVGIPLVYVLLAWAPEWAFRALVVGLAAVGAWEVVRMVERAGRSTHRWLGVVGTAAVTASFTVEGAPTAVLTVTVAVVLSAAIWHKGAPSIEPAATTLLAILYVGWLLGHALSLHAMLEGPGLTLFAVGVTWCGESAAWAIGSTLGRHRLAPVISPRKTIEGAVAQVLASLIGAMVLAAWLLPGWGFPRAGFAGVLLGVVGQVGDLAESVMKRSLGAKDAGVIIPGHGGLLDRLDGLLFNVPALFCYVHAVGGL